MAKGKSSLTIARDVLKNIKTPPSLAFQVRLLSALAAGLSGDWEGAEMVLREHVAPLVKQPQQRTDYNLLCAVIHMKRNRPEEAKPLLEGLPAKVAQYIHPELSRADLLELFKRLDVQDGLLWLLEEFLGQAPQVAYAVYRFLRALPGVGPEERIRVDTALARTACMCRRYKVARRISIENLSNNKDNKFNSIFYIILSVCELKNGKVDKGVKYLARAFKNIESDEEAAVLCRLANSIFRYGEINNELILANAAIKLCENKNYCRATVQAQAWRGFALLAQDKHMLAERDFREAHQALVDLQDTSELRVELGCALGYLYISDNKHDLAENYLRDSLIYATEFCYDKYVPMIKELILTSMFFNRKFEEEYNIFISYIKDSIKYYKKYKQYDKVGRMYYMAARACLECSRPEDIYQDIYRSIHLYLNAYRYSLISDDYKNIEIVFEDMLFIFEKTGVINYFIKQCSAKDEIDKLGILYQICSEIYYKNKSYRRAIKYVKLALEIFHVTKDIYGEKRAIKHIESIEKNLGKKLLI
jgi:tetratricopeptide (TPR) repeat protein